MKTNLQHITINTGHNLPYNRFECKPETIKVCKELIQFALSKGVPVSFPKGEWSHLRFECIQDDAQLVVTVYGPAAPHVTGEPYLGSNVLPMLTFGIMPENHDNGDVLWQSLCDVYTQMYQGQPLMFDKAQTPEQPWLATIIYPSAMAYGDSLGMLADFSRCLAWAWIDFLLKKN